MHIIKLKDKYKAGTILYNIRYEKHHKMLAENEILKCVLPEKKYRFDFIKISETRCTYLIPTKFDFIETCKVLRFFDINTFSSWFVFTFFYVYYQLKKYKYFLHTIDEEYYYFVCILYLCFSILKKQRSKSNLENVYLSKYFCVQRRECFIHPMHVVFKIFFIQQVNFKIDFG